MRKTSLILHVMFLLLVQVSISSCCISKKGTSRWYYSAENLKSVTRPKQFYLVALNSIPHDNFPTEFQRGTVCLIIYGLDSRIWAVNDEFPWLREPLPSESTWNLIDLSKSNWNDSPTALNCTDLRIPQYLSASTNTVLANCKETSVLNLTQIYQRIDNCFGVVLVGDKRCYFFHNRLNFKLHASAPLYQAFFHQVFPHTVLMESNLFQDIEKTANHFSEQIRSAYEK